MSTNLTIRLISNSQRDQLLLKSLLTVVGHRGSINWTHSLYENSCDVVIVDIDEPHPNLAILKKLYQCKSVVVYGAMANNMSMSMADALLVKPLRARDLNSLLMEIERDFGFEGNNLAGNHTLDKLDSISLSNMNTSLPNQKVVSTPIIEESVFSRGLMEDLLMLINKYKDNIVEIKMDDTISLYIDNYRKRALVNQKILKDSYSGILTFKIVDILPKHQDFSLMTFTDLFYDLTLQQANSRLIKGLSPENIYYIKQWPNMGNSRHAKNMVRMAAYFSKQQATLSKAAHDLSVDLNHIIGFINAVYSQNLLMYASNNIPVQQKIVPDLLPKDKDELTASTTTIPQAKNNAVGGLFSRIRQRLGI